MTQSAFQTRLKAILVRSCALALAAGLSMAAHAQTSQVDPEAQRLLKASTDFLAKQQRFSAQTRNTIEAVLKSGQKIEFNHTVRVSAQRPDKLRAERSGDLVNQLFVYDGKSLTVYLPEQQTYSRTAAPATLDAMLDFARTSLDIVAPAGDLIYTNAFAILTEDVSEGFVAGKAVIEGVLCDHLAFRAPHVDLQIWIQRGAQPLPRKMVITTRDLPNAPQFSVTMTRWNLQPAFAADTFSFQPPAGTTKVDFSSR